MAASSTSVRPAPTPSETQLAAIERLDRSLARPEPDALSEEAVGGITERVPVITGVPGQNRRRATVAVAVIGLLGLAAVGASVALSGESVDEASEEQSTIDPNATEPVADAQTETETVNPATADDASQETDDGADGDANGALGDAAPVDDVPAAVDTDEAVEVEAPAPSGEPNETAETAPTVAESTATVRNGQIFLEGAVPTQEAGDELAALAADILGPDNVFNNYVVDPAAGDPDIGNITVEDTITFEADSAVLADPNNPLLAQGVALMNIRPAMTITIVGHTDAQGTPSINDRLSLDRAEAVKAVFVEQGIAADRLTTRGAGASEPIATNDTDAGRAQNRRIQFFLENIFGEA